MITFGEIIKTSREEQNLLLRQVSALTGIDQSIISKFEKGERKPTKEQLIKLAEFYNLSTQELLINWFADKIIYELKDIDYANDILMVAEEKIKYLKANQDEI